MQKTGHPFNVVLTRELHDQLSKMAKASHSSQGQTIRFLLKDAFAMRFQNQPTCSDGNRCLVPHLHENKRGRFDAADKDDTLPPSA